VQLKKVQQHVQLQQEQQITYQKITVTSDVGQQHTWVYEKFSLSFMLELVNLSPPPSILTLSHYL